MKNNDDSCRIGLCFHLDNEKEEKAYKFLQLLDRQKTTYLTNLVLNDLVSRGIFDISTLTKEEVKQMVKLPSATAAQMNLSSVMLGLLQNNFKTIDASNLTVEKKSTVFEVKNVEEVKSTVPQTPKKEETETHYIETDNFIVTDPNNDAMSQESNDLLDEILENLGEAFGF